MKIKSKNNLIIINVDTGTDDALALIVAHKFLKNIIGITTSAGNVSLDKVNLNTNKILNLINAKTKIYPGAERDLKNEDFQLAENFHGVDGLVGVALTNTKNLIQQESATDFIIERVNANPGKIAIVSLAPLTNIALAVKRDPTIIQKIDKIIIMGGTLEVEGNETPKTEFNFYQDPDAAKIILESEIKCFLVTLDVTHKCIITEEKCSLLGSKPVAKFTKEVVNNWYHIFGRKHNRKFELYDPLTTSVIIDGFVDFEEMPIQIITEGPMRGVIQKKLGSKMFVSKKVKPRKFEEFFIDTINSY